MRAVLLSKAVVLIRLCAYCEIGSDQERLLNRRMWEKDFLSLPLSFGNTDPSRSPPWCDGLAPANVATLCGGSRDYRFDAREKLLDTLANLVPDPAKCGQPLLLVALDRRRILQAPVNALRPTRKNRTVVARVVTHRYHVIKFLPGKLVHRFRAMPRNIDPDLAHNPDRLRSHQTRLGTRT